MHCKLKNLAPYTIKYYEENLNFFQPSSPLIKNVDEITQDVIDSYSSMLMGKGDRITAINARLRGLLVFLRFSFKKGWAESYPLSQLKEDEYYAASGHNGASNEATNSNYQNFIPQLC